MDVALPVSDILPECLETLHQGRAKGDLKNVLGYAIYQAKEGKRSLGEMALDRNVEQLPEQALIATNS